MHMMLDLYKQSHSNVIVSCNLVAHHGLRTHEGYILLCGPNSNLNGPNEYLGCEYKYQNHILNNNQYRYHGVAECKYQMYHIQCTYLCYTSLLSRRRTVECLFYCPLLFLFYFHGLLFRCACASSTYFPKSQCVNQLKN